MSPGWKTRPQAGLGATTGIAWTPHLWLGSIVCSGFIGLLVVLVALVVLAIEGDRAALRPGLIESRP
ncbi:MAG: hypothetical protein ABI847_10500 [Anaerolineales bacterium]